MRSADNYADMCTKHLNDTTQERFTYHIHNGTIKLPPLTNDDHRVPTREDDKENDKKLYGIDKNSDKKPQVKQDMERDKSHYDPNDPEEISPYIRLLYTNKSGFWFR